MSMDVLPSHASVQYAQFLRRPKEGNGPSGPGVIDDFQMPSEC